MSMMLAQQFKAFLPSKNKLEVGDTWWIIPSELNIFTGYLPNNRFYPPAPKGKEVKFSIIKQAILLFCLMYSVLLYFSMSSQSGFQEWQTEYKSKQTWESKLRHLGLMFTRSIQLVKGMGKEPFGSWPSHAQARSTCSGIEKMWQGGSYLPSVSCSTTSIRMFCFKNHYNSFLM